MPVIDAHTHIFPPEVRDHRDRYLARDATLREMYADPKAKMATVDDLLTAMDEDGVDVSVVMGPGWTDPGLARESNDYIIECVRKHPRRLVGFGGVNPAWGSKAADEAARCAKAGLRGIGELHPDTQGFDVTDRAVMAPLMEAVQAHRLIVTVHTSEPAGHAYAGKGKTTPDRVLKLVTNFPDVPFILAHWGGGLPFYALMPEVGKALANTYVDTAASPFLYDARVFDAVAAAMGAERILLGSDYPLLRHSRLRAHLDASKLSATAKRAVLGGTAARLFGIA
ncbi:MAG: amidohydrolase [SAR202 cluster bacterium]|nr:amidohydrolase [SAR202 cluster bacterium]